MKKLLLLGLLISVVQVGLSAQTYVIKLGDDLKGSSKALDHRGWIEIQDFNHSVYRQFDSQQRTMVSEQPEFYEMSFTKRIDASSADLQKFATEGGTLPKVELHVLSPEDNSIILSYTFYEVVLTGYTMSMFQGELPMEYISIHCLSHYELETALKDISGNVEKTTFHYQMPRSK